MKRALLFLKPLILTFLLLTGVLTGCSNPGHENNDTEPDWGMVRNPSAERVQSGKVENWTPLNDRNAAMHFYSYSAHHGAKSLLIQSDKPGYGHWINKVSVKPWSKYVFRGWIKTESLVNEGGAGAGYNLGGLRVEYSGLTGTNDWTEVEIPFETEDNDCFVLECVYNRGGLSSGTAWFDDMSLELISSEEINTAIELDVRKEQARMSEYIYGQFIEHLGKCIYGGIWAEMIEDRKFWYEPGTGRSPWKIEGGKELLSMDKASSYVGEQTPVLESSRQGAILLQQDGLGIRKDVRYKGRIILKSSGEIESVGIKLVNAANQELIDETVIRELKNGYNTYPIAFHSTLFTHNASLQIVPEGNGKLWVGTVSLMPEDNISGFRADVLELLKGLDSPVYRWPGGNFVSGYDWKDGIGDRDLRPPRKNPAWSGVEHNDVGIHEFMLLCELLDTEAYIAVNAGLGGAEEARKQLEYCNGTANTPMGKWRSENGKTEPWKVKWWSVGNEMYGSWQLGHMDTEAFVKKHKEFANAMRSVDSDIVLVAVGDPGKWDEMMLSECSGHMDMISEHFYRQDWHGGGLMTHIQQIPKAIKERAEIHRKYRAEIPELEGKDIQICMDEWNYWYGPHIYGELGTRYYLRDALGIAAGMNEFSKNTDIIYMANYAQTVNVIGAIKTNQTHSVYASTGQVLKMYRDHFGTIPVEISGDCRPFDVAATLTEDRKTLVVSVINQTWEEREFALDIKNASAASQMEVYTLTGPDDMAFNEPGREESVRIEGPVLVNRGRTYEVSPYSISLLRIPIERQNETVL